MMEINRRIGQRETAFQEKLKRITRSTRNLHNKFLSMNVRKKAMKYYLEPKLLYGSELWTVNHHIRKIPGR